MQPKQLIIYATTATGLLPLTHYPARFYHRGDPSDARRGDGFKVRSSMENFHCHEIQIMFADVSEPPAGGKTITSSGTVHTHDAVLEMDDYQALQDGAVVIKTSTSDSRHFHTFGIQVTSGQPVQPERPT